MGTNSTAKTLFSSQYKSDLFYREITSFSDFTKVVDEQNFVQAPDDWSVIIADIQGSTLAISEGRYKEVNFIGAACITAVLNAAKDISIPYVFGGDGATLLVPNHHLDRFVEVLKSQRWIASERFGFNLRVGIVPISLINKYGGVVKVAKYCIAPKNYLAMFKGGGLSLAEKWIKTKGPQNQNFLIEMQEQKSIDLTGLSCRWQPLKSHNGKIISLIVLARANAEITYPQIIKNLDSILADITQSSPSQNAQFNVSLSIKPALLEAKVKSKKNWFFDFIKYYTFVLFEKFLVLFKLKFADFIVPKYLTELRQNIDYKKFDDILRMVVDCNEVQLKKIDEMLKKYHQDKQIYYGLHVSDQALMTCLVFSLAEGEHIHFVDGDNGGYTLAAKQLKEQIKSE